MNHVLLTRFNLPSPGHELRVRGQEGWLTERVQLFERYCLPSVAAQTNQNFDWIVYFDPGSPHWLRRRVEELSASRIFVPIFRTTVGRQELLEDVRRVSGGHQPELLTTNLDNDDGLAVDFVDRVQSAPTTGRTAIYLTSGLIKSSRGVFLRTDRRNAFCSVREPRQEPSTCWSDWHTLLGTTMPVAEVAGSPAWLQVVHGSNVSNRVRGRLTSPAAYRAAFPGLLDDVVVPSASDRLQDLVMDGPLRQARETGRAATKKLILNLVGKDGLDRLKLLGANRRN